MGFLFILAVLVILAVFTTILSRFNKNAAIKAYSLLENGLNIAVGSEEDLAEPRRQTKTKRGYISPFTKKLCGSRQHWKCAACGRLLDASYEIDHIVPLHRGGTNDISNLQAICRSPCHVLKSNREASQR